MTAATAPSTSYHYVNELDTEASALEVQRWILHLAGRPVDCRCVICTTLHTTGEHDAF